MAAAEDGEVIFVQNDPNFDLVLNAIQQLRNTFRLHRTHQQSATIIRIERALRENERELAAANPNLRYTWKRFYDFSRTAAIGFRMAMLEATGTPRVWWDTMQRTGQNKREGNMVHEPEPMLFKVPEDEDQAMEYWSHYDQLYPHYYMRQKYKDTQTNGHVPLDSMMVIFRRNFTELIQITTTVRLPKGAPGAREYDASVHVVCTRSTIDQGDMDDEDRDDKEKVAPAFQKLKVLIRTVDFTDTEKAKSELEVSFTEASLSMDEMLKKLEKLKIQDSS